MKKAAKSSVIPQKRRRGKTPNSENRGLIDAEALLKRLQNHALGKVEMTSSEATAARILLNKVLPDMKTVDHTGTVKLTHEDALKMLQ